MLTKSDLQAIQTIVKTETESVKVDLRAEFKETIIKELKPVKKDIKKIKRDVDTMIDFFDKEDVRLRERVEKLEVHTGIVV